MIKNKLGWVFFAFIFALGVGAGGLGGVALADCPAVTISDEDWERLKEMCPDCTANCPTCPPVTCPDPCAPDDKSPACKEMRLVIPTIMERLEELKQERTKSRFPAEASLEASPSRWSVVYQRNDMPQWWPESIRPRVGVARVASEEASGSLYGTSCWGRTYYGCQDVSLAGSLRTSAEWEWVAGVSIGLPW